MQSLAALMLAACSAVALGAEPVAVPKAGVFPHVDTPEATIYRGNIVFKNYCILCHSAKADGTGRAAKLYTPRPAKLVLSDKNDAYKEMIIRQGGGAIGRSEFVPPWGKELTDEQIRDVVAYLRSIRQAKAG